ncbi:MarR family transcriptional regulator [Pectobacterium carotovorum]|uniref:MarR family winged helix-turn-helix transcriptional regulator n=1 Tax=Pectobacterium carotovorum TaxID=554 RepID=UPI0029DD3D79|nr:MarR family transcriptional regulator [Pectobacterium carotovorum]MDX6915219.1 MarR family transcriptional regulator [Pectobacterium carotovorum]
MMKALFALLESYKAQMQEQMKAHDISLDVVHIRLCKIIATEGRITPQSLAKMVGRDKAQITRMVAELVKRDYVRKIDNPDDGRSVWLSLSDKGVAFTQVFLHQGKQIEAQMLQALSPDEQATFSALLEKITANRSAR